MNRRRALVIAGTMTATLAMAGGALAVNMGLLGSDGEAVGNLDATTVGELQDAASTSPSTTLRPRKPDVTIIVQDVPVAGRGGAAPASAGSAPAAVRSSGAVAPAPVPAAPAPAPAPAPSSGGGYDDHHEYEDSHDEPDEPDEPDERDEPDEDDD